MADDIDELLPPRKRLKLEDDDLNHESKDLGRLEPMLEPHSPNGLIEGNAGVLSPLEMNRDRNRDAEASGSLPVVSHAEPQSLKSTGLIPKLMSEPVVGKQVDPNPEPQPTIAEDETPTHQGLLLNSVDSDNQPFPDIMELEQEMIRAETAVGITEYINQGNPGFRGVLKMRYSDFIVNEVLHSGEVARLDVDDVLSSSLQTKVKQPDDSKRYIDFKQQQSVSTSSFDAGKQPDPVSQQESSFEISPEQEITLGDIFDQAVVKQMIDLGKHVIQSSERSDEKYGSVKTQPILDKTKRSETHEAIRSIFNGCLESRTDSNDNTIVVSAVELKSQRKSGDARGRQKQQGSQLSFQKLGGEYLHFTLCKEYKDTNEVLSYLSRQLKMKSFKVFDVSGNKDKRAVTTQRISAHRVRAERLLELNKSLRNAKVGDCSYEPQRLKIAQNKGNEFVITLRDCEFRDTQGNIMMMDVPAVKAYVQQIMEVLKEAGFFNYFGRQRFGAFSSARTDITGIALLNEDYQGVVDCLLQYSSTALAAAKGDSSIIGVADDDKKRALAIDKYRQSPGNVRTALEMLPKRFTAEIAILQAFAKGMKAQGAIESIPRTSRSLYGHAYQSYVWNVVASHRWREHGRAILPGDLVLVKEHRDKEGPSKNPAEGAPALDADGEPIIKPATEDSALPTDDEYLGARALTEQEAASGLYTIFDIVLPLPGHDVLYPEYLLPLYESTMKAHGGLKPHGMRRKWRDISLPGSYRKLLERPFGTIGCEIVSYKRHNADIAVTELQKIEKKRKGQEVGAATGDAGIEIHEGVETGARMAVMLKFQLGSGIYATMALRELMKPGPMEWKGEFTKGRE